MDTTTCIGAEKPEGSSISELSTRRETRVPGNKRGCSEQTENMQWRLWVGELLFAHFHLLALPGTRDFTGARFAAEYYESVEFTAHIINCVFTFVNPGRILRTSLRKILAGLTHVKMLETKCNYSVRSTLGKTMADKPGQLQPWLHFPAICFDCCKSRSSNNFSR